MFAALVAGALLGLSTPSQDPPALPSTPDPEAATRLSDVVVSARDLEERTRALVDEMAAPANHRGLARWGGRVCVGAVNVRQEVAQAMIDRVSRLAADLNLRVGEPGCTPNVVLIFTEDAQGMSRAMVEQDRRAFHNGIGGLDRGRAALDAFQNGDAPVRWWHVSLPVVGATGARAIRFPGDGPVFVPGEGRVNRGRPITDVLNKVLIVVDVDQLEGVSLPQLSDYVAMVAMAQIDPDGDTAAHDTVLNLFSDPLGVDGLSDWDAVYLQALYDSAWERVNPSGQAAAIARVVRRAERDQARRERTAQ
ncbi:hypothetical protein [Brevundimonas sp. FT23028]|uniref:hypothetical protein n=1 Tax=Brevundimonas sp. FT23028 TaxID=3393748 RepID=UPI003B589918